MKRIAFVMITLFVTCSMIMAQGKQGGGDRNMDPKTRAERMTERMVKNYSLTDTQKQQVYDLNFELSNKMAQRSDTAKEQPSKEDRDKMRADMEKARTEYDTKIKTILTKEQYDAYTKDQAERRNRGGQGGGRNK